MNLQTSPSPFASYARLSIRLLGEWQFLLDGVPPGGKLYGKVVALAAYLCVEADRSHAREDLASLLWPGLPAESARGNLRQALRHLRLALGALAPDLLSVTRDTLRFHASHPACSVDVAVLTAALPECRHCAGPASSAPCGDCLARLESQFTLYRGEFLAGLSVPDAPEFEVWLNFRRQSLRECAFLLAERLGGASENAGKADMALTYAQRCLELEPWNEVAHRRYMRLLADQGQPASAQTHYDAFRAGLAHDVNAEPDTGTHALFESIHKSSLTAERRRVPAERAQLRYPKADRRQVTVLCCHLDLPNDVPGTDLERLAESRSVCAAVLRRHAGHIAQGHDGYLYAYLGYPAASEQAGRQAVLAALELQSCFGPPYRFRAGLHTGIIVTGFDPAVPDIIGTVSAVAWELCRGTRASGIAVSETTAGLLRGRFPLQALTPAAAAGEAVAVVREPADGATAAAASAVAYRLLGQDHDDALSAGRPAAPPMIGRRSELLRLRQRWRLAVRGRPQTLVLRGEAGIGKTRLACALVDEAVRSGAEVRQLQCYPEHRHTPLYPLVALLESVLGLTPEDTPAAQRRKLQEYLSRRHPEAAEAAAPVLMMLLSIAPADAPVPSPQQRKQQTLDTMLLLLDSLAASQPVLLMIEDAHWLDVTTLDLLERLLQRTSPAALLTLITARPAFQPAWLRPESVLELRPMPDAAIAQLAQATDASLPAQAVQAIVRRADGIPFYAEEMARMPQAATGWNSDIPPTLRDLLLSRLDSVPQARRLLQLAATIGRRFEPGLLQRVSTLSAAALTPLLNRLVERHLLVAVAAPAGAFQFCHALIQEAAYESQVQTDRQEAHRVIAAALSEQRPQSVAQQPGEIARHHMLAGDPAAAVPWWLEAGRRALQVCAASEAQRHLHEGLDQLALLAPGCDRDARELALLLLLGQAVQLGRGYGAQDAARLYDRAFELSHDQLTLRQRFEIVWGLWTVSSSRPGYGFLKARELAQRLLELARQGNDRELLAKAHTASTNVALWLDQPDEVCRHAGAARAAAGEHLQTTLGGLDPVVACLAYQSWAQWRQGRIPEAQASSDHSLARARSLDNPDSLCIALGFAAMLQRFLGNVQAVAEHTCELQALADMHGLATWQGLGRMLQAWVQVSQGREEGIAVLQACAQGIQQVMPSVAALFLHALAEACGLLHRHDEQLQAIDRGVQAAAGVDERFFGSLLERMRGECQAARESG